MKKDKLKSQECNCEGDCCQPKKGKLWTKIVFFVIVIAALSIVAIKIIAYNNKPVVKAATLPIVKNSKSNCCDTIKSHTCKEVCDSSKNKSCCPKSNK